MNAILGFSQIVNDDPDLDDRHRKSVRIIRQSGEHLLKLINDILDISKIEGGSRAAQSVRLRFEGAG